MMSPQVYEEARASAPIHVQLWQSRGRERSPGDRSVLAVGRVVRIFRDRDHAVRLGQRIAFRVPIIRPSGPDGAELSGTIRHDWHRLGRAHWLEAFMQSNNGEIELVHSQVVAIRRPTRQPVCRADEKGFLCAGNVS
jgi:hypothetical protein